MQPFDFNSLDLIAKGQRARSLHATCRKSKKNIWLNLCLLIFWGQSARVVWFLPLLCRVALA
jgi:hypothetical protein